jgi:hypothetical protein
VYVIRYLQRGRQGGPGLSCGWILSGRKPNNCVLALSALHCSMIPRLCGTHVLLRPPANTPAAGGTGDRRSPCKLTARTQSRAAIHSHTIRPLVGKIISKLKNAVLWDVAPCGFNINWRFRRTCRLHLQGRRHYASEQTCWTDAKRLFSVC